MADNSPVAGGPEHLAPSAGLCSFLQDVEGFTPLDSSGAGAVQPFPRSPKLQRKFKGAVASQELLSLRLEELEAEKTKTDAHIQSLKKRKADLSRSTEVMKHHVQEHFENMHRVLKQDEQAVLDSLEMDLRRTRTRLDQILKDWLKHQEQVMKSISSILAALNHRPTAKEDEQGPAKIVSPKRPNASEKEIKLNEQRFEKLQKSLSTISNKLKTQLQRKTLLLDSKPTVIDRQTSHSQIVVTPKGWGATFSATPCAAPEHPLQFDKVCCALGSTPVTAGLSYWEVDVRCCSGWAVGVAYGSLQRKGADKGAQLGRNRNSWCMELKNGNLSAWHNDRHMVCQGSGQGPPGRVGVRVNYDKGQLTFYDADRMAVLHSFSAALTPVFDRAHHQFTEPLYPAVRFLRTAKNYCWPDHLEFCYSL